MLPAGPPQPSHGGWLPYDLGLPNATCWPHSVALHGFVDELLLLYLSMCYTPVMCQEHGAVLTPVPEPDMAGVVVGPEEKLLSDRARM